MKIPDTTASLGYGYILVGGQEGSWFSKSQIPRLLNIDLGTNSTTSLIPVTGDGTVWTGGSNSSDWLISGWGANEEPASPNPYLYLFNGDGVINGSLNVSSESEWKGADIFAASSNGTSWLVSGMGSGILSSTTQSAFRRPPSPVNHLSAGIFNGKSFTDLTSRLPVQMDGILYANAYNGSNWLVGGGYENQGVLLSYEDNHFFEAKQADIVGRSIPPFCAEHRVERGILVDWRRGISGNVLWFEIHRSYKSVGERSSQRSKLFADVRRKLNCVERIELAFGWRRTSCDRQVHKCLMARELWFGLFPRSFRSDPKICERWKYWLKCPFDFVQSLRRVLGNRRLF